MVEFTPEACGKVIADAIVATWRDQVASDHLNREGLRAVRSHLDPALRHGFTTPDSDLCRVEVHAALAADCGIEQNELPCLWPDLMVSEDSPAGLDG